MGKQPMQPIVMSKRKQDGPFGVIRFQENAIVRFLLDWASQRGMDLNALALMEFSAEDRMQFAQLIGYSVSGFGELSYARPVVIREADAAAEKLLAARVRSERN